MTLPTTRKTQLQVKKIVPISKENKLSMLILTIADCVKKMIYHVHVHVIYQYIDFYPVHARQDHQPPERDGRLPRSPQGLRLWQREARHIPPGW